MTLIASFLILAGALLLVVLISRTGWWFFLKIIGPLLEQARDGVKTENVRRILEQQQQQREAWRLQQRAAQERQGPTKRMVTPEGTTVVLDLPGQLQLIWSCCAELDLPPSSTWKEIKKGWRKQVFKWHPDRGGDPETWLRKLRSYEALEQLKPMIENQA